MMPNRRTVALNLLWIVVGFAALFFFLDVIDHGLSLENLSYRIKRLDPVSALLGATVIVLLVLPSFIRLRREYKIWYILQEPFSKDKDPFIDIDLKTEAYGLLQLKGNTKIKGVSVFVSGEGILVRKAAFPRLFPTFWISWKTVSSLYFVEVYRILHFGSDPFGVARLALDFSEDIVIVLPWRRRFNEHIPDSTGFQDRPLVGNAD